MNNTGNLKKSTFAVLALTLTLLSGGPTDLRAAEADLADPVVSSESYYANPAQAAHAAQLADQAAMSDPDVLAALDEVEAAQAEVDAAQAAFDALDVPSTPAEEAALEAARQDLLDAQTNLGIMEDNYTDAVATATGVNASEIEAMRTAGMGWGDIAHELGVHPSTLGLGHGKKTGTQAEVTTTTTAIDGIEAEELAEATARNTRNGWSRDRDQLNTRDRDQLTTRSRIHEPGTGLTTTGTTAERDKATTRSRIHEPGTGLTATGATAAGNSRAERNADATGDGNTTAGGSNGGGNSNAGGNSDNSGNGNGSSGGSDTSNGNSGGNGNGGGNGGGSDNGNGGGNGHGGGNDNGNSGGNGHGGGNDNGNGGGKK